MPSLACSLFSGWNALLNKFFVNCFKCFDVKCLFLEDCGTLCTFSFVQRDASPRGKLPWCLSNAFLDLKTLSRSHRQTDRQTDNMAWLITHIGTFSTLDVNNLVCFEFGASVAYLFFYSGSVTACKMTEWKTYHQNK